MIAVEASAKLEFILERVSGLLSISRLSACTFGDTALAVRLVSAL